MFRLASEFKRSFLFTLITAAGFFSLLQILQDFNDRTYLGASIVFLIIFLALLYIDHVSGHKKFNQREIFMLDESYYLRHIVNHYFVPVSVFLLLVSYIFLSNNYTLKVLFIILGSIALLLCFINLRSYFLNRLQIEARTHVIYNGMKIFIYFLLSSIILEFFYLEKINAFFTIAAMLLSSFSIIFLIFLRSRVYHKSTFLLMLAGSILAAVSTYISISILKLGFVQANIIVFMAFYFITAVIHHKIEGTLSIKVVTEYLLMLLLSATIMYGLR